MVVEESTSEEEKPLHNHDVISSSKMVVNTDHMIVEGMVESEQVIGPSHLVENKNSFNVISRVANYSTSSSDEGEDAWDDSLLAPVRPKPAAGIVIKAEVEKSLQKRKALHAKYNQFMSAPLPQPAPSSDRHPFGSRGKRGGRRGSQGAGHYTNSGRGSCPTIAPLWSGDKPFHHGNQTRSDVQHGRAIPPFSSSSMHQPFPQQPFPQQQRQFPRPFPHQPQQQLPQQLPPSIFPQQQFPGHQSPSKQDQPWQHSHSPNLRHSFTNKCSFKSTSQVTPTTMTTTTTTNIISISQLDDKGMKNEYEWQKWMVERSVKRTLEGLSRETITNFSSQLNKILSGKITVHNKSLPYTTNHLGEKFAIRHKIHILLEKNCS